MNALSQENAVVSEQEYLEYYSQLPDIKYEYINGEIWAMAGASRNHNVIMGNFFGELRQHLKGAPCKAFASDWRVKCEQHYYYPDVVVDCDSLRDNNQAGQPIVIIEVLSESTRETDLTFKLNDYKKSRHYKNMCWWNRILWRLVCFAVKIIGKQRFILNMMI